MGKIVAAEYPSLDGVTEDPGPAGEFKHRGWTVPYWNDELAEYQSELLFASDALLLERVTYDEFKTRSFRGRFSATDGRCR